MSEVIEVIRNPRRKKRRRYTAKQRAAGFGGRRARRSRPATKRRRRRNPMLASLGNPRRRRNSPRRRPRYTVTGIARRRRRNPRLGPFNINLAAAAWIGAGVLSTELLPRIGRRFWSGLPTVGFPGYGVKIASAVVAGMVVGKITNRNNGMLVTAGGLSMVLVDLFRQYALPHVPFLSGLANDGGTMTAQELRDIYGVGAYVDTPAAGMAAYVENPVGAY